MRPDGFGESAVSGANFEKDTVAVIIPAYNAEKFIRRAVDSVLTQTHVAHQILVINDGSTDTTGEILKTEYGGQITVIDQKNGGLSNARNAGIRANRSEYVAFLDADDWWDPAKLEVQIQSLRSNPDVGASYTALTIFDELRGTHRVQPPAPVEHLRAHLRFSNPFVPPSSVMMRSSLLQQLGGFNEKLRACEDWELWFKLTRMSRFKPVSAPLTWYRDSFTGLSADADGMFHAFLEILDPVLLNDLSGVHREVWKRRIVSHQAYSSFLSARTQGDKGLARRYMWMSLREWPSPFWCAPRMKSFAIELFRS